MDFDVKLGRSTSVLAGYKADVYSTPFIPSGKPALNEIRVIVGNPDLDAKWSWPSITLHENAEDLLTGILPVKLRPLEGDSSENEKSASWPAGAILLSGLDKSKRSAAVEVLSKQLGIDLSRSDWSYALVRRIRLVGTAVHPCYERGVFGHPDSDGILNPETLAALKSLEKLENSTNVSMQGANGYLEFYETFGSHFVSSVSIGDAIFQVFAFKATEYQHVCRIYEDNPGDLSGPKSPSFALFTTPRIEAGYGHTAAIGNICIASQDPNMTKSMNDDLWRDTKYAGTNSIFAPFLRSDLVDVDTTFKKTVPISIELACLADFAEYYRKLIWECVFKGAMYAKYASGSGIAPYFSNGCPYDLDSVFRDSDPTGGDGLLSTLATPSVNIWQENIDVSKVVLQFPELVKTFGIFANGIQIMVPHFNTIIDVPGSDTVTFIGHVITSGGTDSPQPPKLRLSESAFAQIKNRIFCGEFYGGLRIGSTAAEEGDLVIMNGLMFQKDKGKVLVVCDVRESPTVAVLSERVTDIQFALVAAEARLNFLLANSVQTESLELMKRFLLWLAGVAGTNTQCRDEQLVVLQARAMYLVVVAANDKGTGVPVPYLRFDAYKDVVNNILNALQTASSKLTDYQNQIRARKAEERQVDRDKALNENIVNSGKLLQDYIGTQATYQQSLEDIFSGVVQDKEDELEKAIKQADKQGESLSGQRKVVDEAIIQYQDAIAEWQKQETIKAAIDIASSLFSLGFTFVVPASSITALKDLGLTVQRIQKTVKVFDAVIKAYRSIKTLPSNPEKVVDSLKDIGPSGLDLPSSLEWDEMKVNFDATLSAGPDISAKTSLSAAFGILVLRGKALLQTQNSIQGIASDLSAARQRIVLHQDQKKRLDGLNADLNAKPEDLDVAKIDLIGLSGQLIFFERQMLMTLASTLVIQDRALQYEYLRPPTPLGSFTMLNLQLAMINQLQSINKGLTVQPLPSLQEHPIVYEIHGVKPDNLFNNQRFSFVISSNKREFASFNYVRIESVDVEIGGIASTKSGKYYTELVFDGNPFFDRGFNGEPLEFQTTSRIFTGLHEVSASSHVVSDNVKTVEKSEAMISTTGEDPFGGKISSITPFSTWQVSLPKTQSNEDMKFDDYPRGVTVRLTFKMYAQLNETTVTPLERNHAARLLLSRGDYVKHTPQSIRIDASKPSDVNLMPNREQVTQTVASFALAAKSSSRTVAADASTTGAATTVSRDQVLQMMKGKSVCAGWDVVFSMTAEQVNDQLYGQYTNRQGNPTFVRETGNCEKEVKTSEGKTIKTVFNFTFNAPRLQFLLNNSNSAQLFLPITSGHYEYSILINDTWVSVETADVKSSDGSYIQGDVPLAILPGSVSSQQNVAIKLKGGAFSARKFEASTTNPTFGFALTEYFTNLKDGYEVYNLGILDLTGITVLDSLNPNEFKFNVYHTPSNRDLLQLFIATSGRMQSSTALYLQEPIPSHYDSSLIISSEIFFKDVLPTSLGDGGIGLSLESTEPEDNANKDKTWSSRATAGSVSAPFSETKVGTSTTGYEGGTTTTESYVKVDDDKAVVDLTGMQFLPGDETSGYDVKMMYSPGFKKCSFEYGSRSKNCGLFGCSKWSKKSFSSHSLGVNIDMSTILPIDVTGTGQNQLIGIAAAESSVNLTGNLKPPGNACKCNDRDLQKKFLSNLQKTVPSQLVDVFNQNFDTVSIFALKNLLFPANNFIDLKEGCVPGDMVIFGNFTPT